MILITSSPVQLDNEDLLQRAEHTRHLMMATGIVANSCQFTVLVPSMSYLLPILSILVAVLETCCPQPDFQLFCSLVSPNTNMKPSFLGGIKPS